MSYGQYFWLANRTWIPCKDSSRGRSIVPIQKPMSILNVALVSIKLTVAHMPLLKGPEQIPISS